MMKVLTVSIALFLHFNLLAQEIDTLYLEPGSDYIDGSFLKNYTNKWAVSFVDLEGNTTPNKIWTDYGEIVELGGKTYLHRVQDIYSAELVHLDTWVNMVEKSSLKPWQFYAINSSGGNSFYQFSDQQLTITSNRNKEKIQKSDTLKLTTPLFDWNLYGMLLVGLPFKTEVVYQLPYYNASKQKIDRLFVTFEGEEEIINMSDRKIKAWKVKCSDGLVFWLTKSAPYVIQLESPIPNRGKIFWNSY